MFDMADQWFLACEKGLEIVPDFRSGAEPKGGFGILKSGSNDDCQGPPHLKKNFIRMAEWMRAAFL